MRVLVISFLLSALSLAATATGLHADDIVPPQPPRNKKETVEELLQSGKVGGRLTMTDYDPSAPRNVILTEPFFTPDAKAVGVSPYLVGRAAKAAGYTSNDIAVTFDYSGTSLWGHMLPPNDELFWDVGMTVNYPCITADNQRRGNLFAVYIDGDLVTTIDFGSYFIQQQCGKDTTIMFAHDLAGAYNIKIVKLTEPNYNAVADNTHNNITFIDFAVHCTQPLKLSPMPKKNLRMEFLGDSISAGYWVDCRGNMDPSVAPYTMESVIDAVDGLTCRSLNADCHYISWSGRGLYLNLYDSSANVATLYNYTMGTVLDDGASGELWDFSAFTPHIVVINLGSNDFDNPAINTGDNIAKFVETYVATLWQIASNYGPTTVSIVTTCGPMSYKYCDSVQSAIKKVTTDHPTMRTPFFMQYDNILTPSNECGGHPDAEVSAQLADQLRQFIKKEVMPTLGSLV